MIAMAKPVTWQAVHPDFIDEIHFAPEALKHLRRHRQLGLLAREAGGQLFGKHMAAGLLVTVATGPYNGDARTRTSYRSNPVAADRMIDAMRKKGLLYLGEWHTHPEKIPGPSGNDIDAFVRLCANSEHPSETLILVIQGQMATPMGLAVLTRDDNQLTPWSVTELT